MVVIRKGFVIVCDYLVVFSFVGINFFLVGRSFLVRRCYVIGLVDVFLLFEI